MEKTWTVVKFIQEDSVEAVPSSWIVGNRCYWPPFTQKKLLAAIKNFEAPSTCWPSHEMTIFKNGTFDNYLEARRKCKIAEIQSELSEEDLKNRKIRNRKVISPTSTSEDELIPDPPLQKKIVPLRMNEKANDKENLEPAPSHSLPGSTFYDLTLTKLSENFETFTKEFMRKQNLLTSMLADVLSEVRTLKDCIKDLDICKKSESSTLETFYDKVNLPVKSIEDVNEIEDYLGIPENFPKVVEEMSKVGGNSPFEFIKRVLLRLMIYKVAACYTWNGTKEKLSFKTTKMAQMIMKASNGIGNEKQIEEALQKFFRRAKERSASTCAT